MSRDAYYHCDADQLLRPNVIAWVLRRSLKGSPEMLAALAWIGRPGVTPQVSRRVLLCESAVAGVVSPVELTDWATTIDRAAADPLMWAGVMPAGRFADLPLTPQVRLDRVQVAAGVLRAHLRALTHPEAHYFATDRERKALSVVLRAIGLTGRQAARRATPEPSAGPRNYRRSDGVGDPRAAARTRTSRARQRARVAADEEHESLEAEVAAGKRRRVTLDDWEAVGATIDWEGKEAARAAAFGLSRETFAATMNRSGATFVGRLGSEGP